MPALEHDVRHPERCPHPEATPHVGELRFAAVSVVLAVRGSSAIRQIGQVPGPGRRISERIEWL